MFGMTSPRSACRLWIIRRKERPTRLLIHFLLEGVIPPDRTSPRSGRSRVDRTKPAFEVGEGSERRRFTRQRTRSAIQPSPAGDIGNRVLVPNDEIPSLQMGVEHLVMPL